MKKSAWQKSEFGKIKAVNIFNAAYHSLMSLIPQILTFVGMGRMPSDSEFYLGLSVVASVFLGSIFKGLNTNSNGTPFKKEQ